MLVRYQTDYIIRLIEQLSGLIRGAVERLGMKEAGASQQLAGQAIGLALGMDPELASSLSAQSLAAMFSIGSPDDRITELVLQAIELEATVLDDRGDATTARLRHEQAAALRSLLESKTQPTT